LGNTSSTGEKIKTEDEQKIDLLTEREFDVINLIAQGFKNKAIAETLFISEATVRHHLTSIFNKLEVKDRMNLLIFGYKNQLLAHEKK
jgi:DNA-binding NarL/FixJ family response regulator